MKCMLELDLESINVREEGGFMPIHHAVDRRGKEETQIIRFLLTHDPDSAARATT